MKPEIQFPEHVLISVVSALIDPLKWPLQLYSELPVAKCNQHFLLSMAEEWSYTFMAPELDYQVLSSYPFLFPDWLAVSGSLCQIVSSFLILPTPILFIVKIQWRLLFHGESRNYKIKLSMVIREQNWERYRKICFSFYLMFPLPLLSLS